MAATRDHEGVPMSQRPSDLDQPHAHGVLCLIQFKTGNSTLLPCHDDAIMCVTVACPNGCRVNPADVCEWHTATLLDGRDVIVCGRCWRAGRGRIAVTVTHTTALPGCEATRDDRVCLRTAGHRGSHDPIDGPTW